MTALLGGERLARGKKTSPQMVSKILKSYAKTQNYSETARELELSVGTIFKIVNDNKDKIRNHEKPLNFEEKASELIDMGLEFLNMRFKRALDTEKAIRNGSIEPDEIKNLPKLSEITSAIGALYDKRGRLKGRGRFKRGYQHKY